MNTARYIDSAIALTLLPALFTGCHRPDALYVDSYYNAAPLPVDHTRFAIQLEEGESGDNLKGRLLGRAIANNANQYINAGLKFLGLRFHNYRGPGLVYFMPDGPRPGYSFDPLSVPQREQLGRTIRRSLTSRGFTYDDTQPHFIVAVAARFGPYGETTEAVTRWETHVHHDSSPAFSEVKDARGRTRQVPNWGSRTYVSEGWAHYRPDYQPLTAGAIELRIFAAPLTDRSTPLWEAAAVYVSPRPWQWSDHRDTLVQSLLDEFPTPTDLPRAREVE